MLKSTDTQAHTDMYIPEVQTLSLNPPQLIPSCGTTKLVASSCSVPFILLSFLAFRYPTSVFGVFFVLP